MRVKLVITGAAGSVGSFLARHLAQGRHELMLVDRDDAVAALPASHLVAAVEDRAAMEQALQGADALIHCAWSFADDPVTTMQSDVGGYLTCLEAAVHAGVKRVLFLSSAVVYGQPHALPITKEHPCYIHAARSPLYAAAKLAAEHLGYVYAQRHQMTVTNLRFWWAFGAEIGGRNLRELVKKALAGEPLEVPAGAGGSFVWMPDIGQFVDLWLSDAGRVRGHTYNAGTAYLTWEQVAGVIKELTGMTGDVRTVPAEEWRGGSFLLGAWHLAHDRAAADLGFTPGLSAEAALRKLREAMVPMVRKLTTQK